MTYTGMPFRLAAITWTAFICIFWLSACQHLSPVSITAEVILKRSTILPVKMIFFFFISDQSSNWMISMVESSSKSVQPSYSLQKRILAVTKQLQVQWNDPQDRSGMDWASLKSWYFIQGWHLTSWVDSCVPDMRSHWIALDDCNPVRVIHSERWLNDHL